MWNVFIVQIYTSREIFNISPHPTGNMDFYPFQLIFIGKEAVEDNIYGVEFSGRIIWLKWNGWKKFWTQGFQPGNFLKRSDNWSWYWWNPESGFTPVSGVKTYFFTQHTFMIRFHPSNQSRNHKQTDEQMFFFRKLRFKRRLAFIKCFGSWKMRKWLTEKGIGREHENKEW